MKHRGSVLIAAGQRLRDSSPPSPEGLVPPDSIDPTGATNVSAALQAWMNAQPNGSTFDFTNRTYRSDLKLLFTARSDLTILGGYIFTDAPTPDGSPIDTTSPYDVASRTRSHWELSACSGITFRGMTIRGANPFGGTGDAAYEIALEAQHGFNIRDACSNIEIDDVLISDIYGDFICIANNSTGIEIHHCEMTRNGRMGIGITGASDVWFHHNNMYNLRRACWDFEPNLSTIVDGAIFEDNTIGDTRLNWVASHGGGRVDNVTIRNNVLTGKAMQMDVSAVGLGVTRLNWVVDGNTSNTSFSMGAGGAMLFELCEHVTVTNNVQPITSTGNMAMAHFDRCVDVTHQGNTASGADVVMHNNESRYVKNCGNRITSGGTFTLPEACVVDYGTPKQYAGLTGWFDAYQDADTYADLAAVSAMTDWSGAGQHLVSSGSARPTMRYNIGGKALKCYTFDGTDDFVGNTLAASAFLTASAYTVFMVFEATTIVNNDAVWSDSLQRAGLNLLSTPEASAYNLDSGGADTVLKPLTLNKCTLIMMRHESGNLYVSKDGAAETSVTSGDTTSLAGLIRIGANAAGSQFSHITFYTGEFYNVALTAPQIADRTNRLMVDLKVNYLYGAADTFSGTESAQITNEQLQGKPYTKPSPSLWQYVGGKAKLTNAWATAGVNWLAVDCGVWDGTVQVDIDAALGGSLLFRWGNQANYNMLIGGGGALTLYTNITDHFTVVRSGSGLASTGTRQLKVVMSGSTIQSYYDGALIWTDTITNQQTSTYHGLFQFATSAPACTWDNFLMTPL